MDFSYFLIPIVLLLAIDLYAHWWIANREVEHLKAESKRFEAARQELLDELNEALKR